MYISIITHVSLWVPTCVCRPIGNCHRHCSFSATLLSCNEERMLCVQLQGRNEHYVEHQPTYQLLEDTNKANKPNACIAMLHTTLIHVYYITILHLGWWAGAIRLFRRSRSRVKLVNEPYSHLELSVIIFLCLHARLSCNLRHLPLSGLPAARLLNPREGTKLRKHKQ